MSAFGRELVKVLLDKLKNDKLITSAERVAIERVLAVCRRGKKIEYT